MNKLDIPIAVASRTFSRHETLRRNLLERFSNVKFNDEGLALSGASLVEFLRGRIGAIIALEKVTDEVLAELPELRVISKYGVGLDNLDQEAIKRRGIQLGWTGGVNRRAVAELALTFALGLIRQVFLSTRWVAGGKWQYPGGFQLSGKTVGVVGCGFIGSELVELLKPFGCRVLVADILDKSELCRTVGAKQVGIDELLRESDVISLHVPYGPKTHHLIGARELGLMKKSAVLVNTSRGGVVDEQALLQALQNETIAGAASDVFATEPPGSSPLLQHPKFYATPHIGGSSAEAVLAMGNSAIENLTRLLSEGGTA